MHSEYSRHQRNRRPESWGATLGGVLAGCVAFVLFAYAVAGIFGAVK